MKFSAKEKEFLEKAVLSNTSGFLSGQWYNNGNDEQIVEWSFKLSLEQLKQLNQLFKEPKTKKINQEIYRKFAHLSITVEKYNALNLTFSENEIIKVLDDIENYKQNTKYTSLYLTAKNWLNKRAPVNDKIIAGRQTLETIKSNMDMSEIINPYIKKNE